MADFDNSLPLGGLAGLGDALLRAVERELVFRGEALPAEAEPALRALMNAFSRAEERGNVCVRAESAALFWKSSSESEREAGEPLGEEARLKGFLEGVEVLKRLGLVMTLEGFIEEAKLDLRRKGEGVFAPILMDDKAGSAAETRLYFARFALEELMLAQSLLRLAGKKTREKDDASARAEAVDRIAAASGADSLQKKAIEVAVTESLAIISGGPGTGKTTTVAQILECLLEEKPDLRIALAAPTGKATSRMDQSMRMSVGHGFLPKLSGVLAKDETRPEGERQVKGRTIHKWLLSPTPAGGFPGPGNPLPVDVIVVDEASMVDIHLAARLFDAVGEDTRVIILGDKHQLAAVGPGAVFAELSDPKGVLGGHVVELEKSRRFEKGTVIARLAEAINHQGDAARLTEAEVFEQVLSAFSGSEDEKSGYEARLHEEKPSAAGKLEREVFNRTGLTRAAREWLDSELGGYAGALLNYRDAWMRGSSAEELGELMKALWARLSEFRALAAQRRGAMSVTAINNYADEMMRRLWPQADGAGAGENYPGRVVIVRRNDDGLGVYNGDVGIVLPQRAQGHDDHTETVDAASPAEPGGESLKAGEVVRTDRTGGRILYMVYFGDQERALPAQLLPSHDTAWAMTIHQSQGSEFERVAVFLPERPDSGLATRELLYTGVTRTKRKVDVFASRQVLAEAVRRPTVRDGNLGRRLALGRLDA